MYNNPYINAYNPQMSIDKINEQINNLEKLRTQMQQPVQPTNLTQNFQLAPTNRDVIKYAGSLEEVQRDMVIGDTPYFSKDMSVVWIKNTKGEIKTYELNEIVPLDEKDMQIKYLQEELNKMKKEKEKYEQHTYDNDETSTTKNDGNVRTTTKKSKPTSISNVSKCKEE